MTTPTLEQILLHTEIELSPVPTLHREMDKAKMGYLLRICHRALEHLELGTSLEALTTQSDAAFAASRTRSAEVIARFGGGGASYRPAQPLPKSVSPDKAANTAKILAALAGASTT